MHIFFDTEFTQFRNGELLSIGLVSEADHQLYLEIDDPARHARASTFCQDIVLPQFGLVDGAATRSDSELGARLADWLESFDSPLVLGCDYKLDWHFLEAALRGAGRWHAASARLKRLDVAEVASSEACLAAQEAYFERSGYLMRHHALVDALALRERWRAMSS